MWVNSTSSVGRHSVWSLCIFCPYRSAVCHFPDLHQRGGLLVILQYAASWPTGLSDHLFLTHSLTSWKVVSCSFTHFCLSCSVILQFLRISGLLCIHTPSLHASLIPCRYFSRENHAEVRTLVLASTVTAELNKTSFHPFIFNRGSHNGLEVLANTFLGQVISYCAVLRLPPIRPRCGEDLISLFSSAVHLLLTSQNKFMVLSDLRFSVKPDCTDKVQSWFLSSHCVLFLI